MKFINLSEEQKLEHLINYYSQVSLSKHSRADYQSYFYRYVYDLLILEQSLQKYPEKEQQLKALYEVRKRFHKKRTVKKNIAEHKDFSEYFEQKFSDEIKQLRLEKTGKDFSQKKVDYLNKKETY